LTLRFLAAARRAAVAVLAVPAFAFGTGAGVFFVFFVGHLKLLSSADLIVDEKEYRSRMAGKD
jgi:hypothetical protein